MSNDYDDITTDDLTAEIERRQSAARRVLGIADPRDTADAATAASVAARSGLASGGVGDVGAVGPHPRELARRAIHEAMNVQHLGRQEAIALGVAQVVNAALRGDERAKYKGRTEPG